MSDQDLTLEDYPISERRPELVRGRRGKALEDLSLAGVAAGEVALDDLRITPRALLQQAQIARAAGRAALAENFERASEMAEIPQAEIMAVYELLRPGRAAGSDELKAAADRLRRDHGAERLAGFLEEAAEVYERRDLFAVRF